MYSIAPRDRLTSGSWTTASRNPWSSSHKLADDPQRSLQNEYTLRDSDDPGLVIARGLIVSNTRQVTPVTHTLCSMASFLETFWKYPSHILLNRSLMSFSTSSSVSGTALSVSSVPFSTRSPLIAAFGDCGGMTPKYGRE